MSAPNYTREKGTCNLMAGTFGRPFSSRRCNLLQPAVGLFQGATNETAPPSLRFRAERFHGHSWIPLRPRSRGGWHWIWRNRGHVSGKHTGEALRGEMHPSTRLEEFTVFKAKPTRCFHANRKSSSIQTSRRRLQIPANAEEFVPCLLRVASCY